MVSGIATVTIEGNSLGGSFALSDITHSSVPEPSSRSLLVLTALIIVVSYLNRTRMRKSAISREKSERIISN
jgi:hypothetical protein